METIPRVFEDRVHNLEFYAQKRIYQSVKLLNNRLSAAHNVILNGHNQRYLTLAAKLDALSPLKVLTRGYAMVQDGDDDVIRSVKQTTCGNEIKITLKDGTVSATVTQIKENAL